LETVKIRKILPLSSKNTGECGLRCYFYGSGCEGESIWEKENENITFSYHKMREEAF
jgi:hypothetical protein